MGLRRFPATLTLSAIQSPPSQHPLSLIFTLTSVPMGTAATTPTTSIFLTSPTATGSYRSRSVSMLVSRLPITPQPRHPRHQILTPQALLLLLSQPILRSMCPTSILSPFRLSRRGQTAFMVSVGNTCRVTRQLSFLLIQLQVFTTPLILASGNAKEIICPTLPQASSIEVVLEP
jgi:hypothetical protein